MTCPVLLIPNGIIRTKLWGSHDAFRFWSVCAALRLSTRIKTSLPIFRVLHILLVLFFTFQAADNQSHDISKHTLVVRHARHIDPYLANREQYFQKLLELALKKTLVDYRLQPVLVEPHSELSSAKHLLHGKFDVLWLNTSVTLEHSLEPIRIPLFKGMIGWRIFLIHKDNVNVFKKLDSLTELRSLYALQGESWPDTEILRINGLPVITSKDFRTLAKMLDRGRGDYYPRSITEAWIENAQYKNFHFQIETSLALVYPAAYYFFVRKEDHSLHNTIEKGLSIAIRDGSFDELFWMQFREDIEKSNLSKRRIFKLTNPLLPKATPLDNEALWFKIEDVKQYREQN